MQTLIIGILAMGLILFIYSMEFKKDENKVLYYFCMICSTFTLPMSSHLAYLYANETYGANAVNSVAYLDTAQTTIFFIWFVVFVVIGILLFKKFILDAYNTSKEMIEKNDDE